MKSPEGLVQEAAKGLQNSGRLPTGGERRGNEIMFSNQVKYHVSVFKILWTAANFWAAKNTALKMFSLQVLKTLENNNKKWDLQKVIEKAKINLSHSLNDQ